MMQNHNEATVREGIICSLQAALVDLIWCLGLLAPVSETVTNLGLVHGTVTSFDLQIQKIYKLQQGKAEKVPVYVT